MPDVVAQFIGHSSLINHATTHSDVFASAAKQSHHPLSILEHDEIALASTGKAKAMT